MNSTELKNYLVAHRPNIARLTDAIFVDDTALPEGFYDIVEGNYRKMWENFFSCTVDKESQPVFKSMRDFLYCDMTSELGELITYYCKMCYCTKNPLRMIRITSYRLYLLLAFRGKATPAEMNEASMYRYLLDYLGN